MFGLNEELGLEVLTDSEKDRLLEEILDDGESYRGKLLFRIFEFQGTLANQKGFQGSLAPERDFLSMYQHCYVGITEKSLNFVLLQTRGKNSAYDQIKIPLLSLLLADISLRRKKLKLQLYFRNFKIVLIFDASVEEKEEDMIKETEGFLKILSKFKG